MMTVIAVKKMLMRKAKLRAELQAIVRDFGAVTVSEMECRCGTTWSAFAPPETDMLECPHCGVMVEIGSNITMAELP